MARPTLDLPSSVIRCRTVRQLSAEERWDKEFVLSIKGTPWSPDGERGRRRQHPCGSPPRLEAMEAAHPPDIDTPIIPRRTRLTKEVFGEVLSHRPMLGMPCHSHRSWAPANHTERSLKRIQRELEKEPEGVFCGSS